MSATSYQSGLRHRRHPQDEAAAAAAPDARQQTWVERAKGEDDSDDDALDDGSAPQPQRRRSSQQQQASSPRQGQPGSPTPLAERSFLNAIQGFFSESWDAILRFFQTRAATPASPRPAPNPRVIASLEQLIAIRRTVVSVTEPDHVVRLQQLWTMLLPEQQFELQSKQWKQLGFQGVDPTTDFRGQGLLSLMNMIEMAQREPDLVQHLVRDHSTGYPFALTIINISAHLVDMLHAKRESLPHLLFQSGDPVADFHELFALVYLEFHRFHQQSVQDFLRNGGNPMLVIMQFNVIRKTFFEELARKIDDGRFERLVRERVPRVASAAALSTSPPASPTATDPLMAPRAQSTSALGGGGVASGGARQREGNLITFE